MRKIMVLWVALLPLLSARLQAQYSLSFPAGAAGSGQNCINIANGGSIPGGNNDRTVELWYKMSQTGQHSTLLCIGPASFGGLVSNTAYGIKISADQYWIWMHNNDRWIGALTYNSWTHVALVQSSGNYVLYVNGNNVGTFSTSTNTNAQSVWLGNGGDTYCYVGLMDEVRIWNRALSQSEIQQNMNKILTPVGDYTSQGLVGYWGFDEGSSSGVVDETGKNGAGTIVGTATWSTDVPTLSGSYPPAAPSLNSPADGATGQSANPTLSWNASTGATSYRLQVSTSSSFGTTVYDNASLTGTSQQVGPLADNTTYYWRVSASNANGTSTYSSTRSFTTNLIASGLVAWYPFSGDAVDSSGNGSDGSLHGTTPTANRFGQSGKAYHFNGTSAYISASASSAWQSMSGLTVSAWVKLETNNTAPEFGIFARYTPSLKTDFALLVINQTTTRNLQPVAKINGVWSPVAGSTSIPRDSWFHVTMVYDGSNLKSYVNGTNDGSRSAPGVLSAVDPTLIIGGYDIGSYPAFFQGDIDDIRIYNRALTGAEITALYSEGGWTTAAPAAPTLSSPVNSALSQPTNVTLNWIAATGATTYRLQVSTSNMFVTTVYDDATLTGTSQAMSGLLNNTTYYWRVSASNAGGTSPFSTVWSFTTVAATGPVAYYPFNGNANDESGNAYHGVVHGATLSSDRFGVANRAYRFNGNGNYIDVAGGPLLNATNALTVSAWVQMDPSVVQDSKVVITKGTDNAHPETSDYTLIVNNTDVPGSMRNKPHLWAANDWQHFVGSTQLQGGTWYHLVMTFDGSTIRSFVNGTNDGSKTVSGSIKISNTSLRIGVYWTTLAPGWFPGSIDDIRIYNRPLSDAEINALYTEGGWPIAAPSAPTLALPANLATSQPTNVTLSWNASTGATSYRLQVSTSPSFSTTILDDSTITATSKQLSSLQNNTTYYWRINAKNVGGTSAYSSSWSFTTTLAAPAAPTLASPSNGAASQPTSLTLNWSASTGASSYQVQVSATSFFSSTVYDQNNITGTSQLVTGLNNGSTYYWRVNASNAAGTSSWTTAWSFTTVSGSAIAIDVPLTVSDGAGGIQELRFGLDPAATDGFNASLGESELPPMPPTGVFDARFVGDEIAINLGQGSRKDYRQGSTATTGTKSHEIRYQVGSGSSITISWNFSSIAIPITGTLQDIVTGSLINVPMSSAGSFTVTNPVVFSKLKLTVNYGNIPKSVTVSAGWNILSVPLLASDMSVSGLFPDASSSAFGFGTGYTSATTLSTGKGYWLKFSSGKTYTVTGAPVRPPTISLSSGWNMIGPFDFDLATSTISSSPASIIASSFYGYNNGYTVATTLSTGKGYWLKASQTGTLNLVAPSSSIRDAIEPVVHEENTQAIALIIEDNVGHRTALYLTEGKSGPELPPVPPEGVFDVRFGSNTNVEAIGSGNHEILLNSVIYPLRIFAQGTSGRELWIGDDLGGSLIHERAEEGRFITIRQHVSKIILSEKIQTEGIPAHFELSQNFPNPFNPTTLIRYRLPEAGHVRLAVYSVLGEKVAALVEGEKSAGMHQVEFNAANIPSGIYLYRLDTGGFTAMKKLVVLK